MKSKCDFIKLVSHFDLEVDNFTLLTETLYSFVT